MTTTGDKAVVLEPAVLQAITPSVSDKQGVSFDRRNSLGAKKMVIQVLPRTTQNENVSCERKQRASLKESISRKSQAM
jgi:hypothetical protein